MDNIFNGMNFGQLDRPHSPLSATWCRTGWWSVNKCERLRATERSWKRRPWKCNSTRWSAVQSPIVLLPSTSCPLELTNEPTNQPVSRFWTSEPASCWFCVTLDVDQQGNQSISTSSRQQSDSEPVLLRPRLCDPVNQSNDSLLFVWLLLARFSAVCWCVHNEYTKAF